MLRKMIAWMLLVTVTATVTVGRTLAYLTDRDSEANVFTEGDVSIDLKEDFEQGETLVPGVEIEKKPTIANTGKNDAWVWATVAVPGDLTDVVDFVNQNSTDWDWTTVAEVKDVEINGAKYTLLTALHNEKLASGAETKALFDKVALDKTVDIDPEGNWYTVNAGVPETLNWNNSDGNPVIYVSAYAIQTDGFDTAKAAYDAYMAQWGENGTEYAEPATIVSTAEELTAALSEGGPVALVNDITVTDTVNIEKASQIDLNGHNLIVSILEAKADTEISNGTLSHGRSTYPAVSVSAGTLTLNHVDVVCENYCNLVTGNSGAQASEYVGVQVWSGACVMNDSTITVKADVVRYSNTVIGVGINGGSFTMNGGYIEVINPGSTRVNYETALFASGNADKEVNLNGVTLKLSDKAVNMYAWGGNTTVNTTDADDSWNGKVSTAYGGTYTVNYTD